MRIITVIFFVCFSLHLSQAQEVIDRIVGQVGGELILLSEIEEVIAYNKASQGGVTDKQKCRIIENTLVQKLLINQAKLDSLVVSEEEVNSQLESRIDRILGMMGNDVAQFEEYYGRSISEVRSDMRKDMKNQMLSQRMRQQVMSNVSATPEEVISFYKNMHEDSLPYYNSEVELQELVVKPQITDEAEQEILDQLNDLKNRIENGESFEELASTYSDDPGSASRGGMIGMTKRGTLAPEYEAVAYNLEKDQISDPVKTNFGYHIIQLLDRRGNNFSTRHILITPKVTEEDIQRTVSFLDSIRHLIVTDSVNFEDMVDKHGYEKIPSYSYGGRVINNATGDNFFEVGDLEPDTYFAIDTLDAGEVTKPIKPSTTSRNPNDILVKIVKLLSISKPHKASLKKDFAKIQKMATEHKKTEMITSWVEDKLKNTYIELNLPYENLNCKSLQMWQREIAKK